MPKTAEIRALGEFAASRLGVFNLQQAAESNISPDDIARMVRDGVVVRLHPGVYAFTACSATWRRDAYAATVASHVVTSFRTAAELLALDGRPRLPKLPDVTCHHTDRVRLRGVSIHRTRSLSRADVTMVDGIPCTTLARTVIDLASVVEGDPLIRMIDDVQRRGCDMRWLLHRAKSLQGRGRTGPRAVIEIVERRMNGYRVTESWFESLLERCLQSPLLAGLVRQHTLYDADGEFVARFDLALLWVRLGIEAHSRGFHLGELVECYDESRDIKAAKQGWDVAYLGFAATRSPAEVCADIEAIVRRRCEDLGFTLPPGL